ncbi:hypothetical protein GC169_03840 [bacterium]|nr:hypothetical protein [bacterium]
MVERMGSIGSGTTRARSGPLGADELEGGRGLSENARAAITFALASATLIGLVIGAIVVLTGPDGWVTRAANTAVQAEQTTGMLINFADNRN